ncbi:DUF3099 domain-containing protein [Nocardioides sp. KIGAM211]|uniref:DUF3099 domain-containing protein n=1 Tax=Nocardioides luti TaxID=2761101 RepID=A0A7X0RCV9_9ACTN|nr:DUF3099 domain-containing protein [Nocardioides luti]MBB6625921.1 DUF3099 domain-containing protein [Nocardioides luti]
MARTHSRRTNVAEPVRITTAASSRAADINTRQKRYLISMSIRSICFIGAVSTAIAGITWAWPWLIAGALILPYIAVVLANSSATRSDDFSLRDVAYGRPELLPGTESARHSGPDHI